MKSFIKLPVIVKGILTGVEMSEKQYWLNNKHYYMMM